MTDFSYQLYSSRNFPPLADTLAMLAGLGYAQVEGYGGVYEDPEATAALLRETGLTMPSGHVGLDMLEGDPAGTVAMARTLGMGTLAEGIETAEQAAMMRAIGCGKGQGYLFSKPLERDALVQWILDRSPGA